MVFGKEIVYQDAYSVGTNNNRYFAEDINEFIMAMQGNYVVSGCAVSVGSETNLGVSGNHLAVASGTAFVNGAVRTIGATNIDLNTAFSALSAGEARLILVYITNAGAIATKSGDIVTDGNQLPEVSSTGWTGDNTTPLAWIYLVASDTTMSANQIFNQIVYAPNGIYLNGLIAFNDGSEKTISITELGYISDGIASNFANMTNTIWGFLDDVNQALDTTASPTFGGGTFNGDVSLSVNDLIDVQNIARNSTTDRLLLFGGTLAAAGGNILLYGASHATQASDIQFRVSGTTKLLFDNSDNQWEYSADIHMGDNDITQVDVIHGGTGSITVGITGQGTTYDGSTHTWRINTTNKMQLTSTAFIPWTDDNLNLGGGSNRWKEVFAVAGSINTSSLRYKTIISDIDGDKILNTIKSVKTKYYQMHTRKEKKDRERINVGVIAEEIYKHEPSLVYIDEEGRPDGLYNSQMVAYLWGAVSHLIDIMFQEKV